MSDTSDKAFRGSGGQPIKYAAIKADPVLVAAGKKKQAEMKANAKGARARPARSAAHAAARAPAAHPLETARAQPSPTAPPPAPPPGRKGRSS